MIEKAKQLIPLTPTVVIDTTTGRHNINRKKQFTIGYGKVNTWNLDNDKPPATLLTFNRDRDNLEVEPTNPDHLFLIDGKQSDGESLSPGIEYTIQIQDEFFLIQVTAKPMAWLGRIKLDKWLLFEPDTGNTYGPLDKFQLEHWVLSQNKEPEKLIYLPQGSSKGFYVNQLLDMELPAPVPQKDIPQNGATEETTYTPPAKQETPFTPPPKQGESSAPVRQEKSYTRSQETKPFVPIKEEKPYAPNKHDAVLEQLRCPHCWSPFLPSQLLAIAAHESLRGDPLLGPDEMLRFKPKSYDNHRLPLDSSGTPCLEKACPQCRLKIPHGLSDTSQAIISIMGSPGAGKSYYLSVLVDQLQKRIFEKWGLQWEDADPTANAALNSMRHRLFSAQYSADAYLAKTSMAGHLYSKVTLNGRTIKLPKPFTYILEGADQQLQSLTFYDNAGEHFQPDSDGISNPVTHHLAYADFWCFLFDPSKDATFRKHIKSSKDPQLGRKFPTENQELLLSELKTRIRVLHQLPPHGKMNIPLAFIVGKSDMLEDWEPVASLKDPWNGHHLDSLVVQKNSDILRRGLMERIPAIVARAESLSEKVVYFASSSFGHAPRRLKTGELSPIPKRLNPKGVEVPVMWWLSSWSSIFKPESKPPASINRVPDPSFI